MRVKGTFLSAHETEEGLNRNFKIIETSIKEKADSLTLETDEGDFIGKAIEVFIEDDHIAIIYEVEEKFKEELIKEGFEIID